MGGPSAVVDLASMADSRRLYEKLLVVYGVHHAVVAHADSPFVVAALQLFAARRAGIACQRLQPSGDTRNDLVGETLQFFLCARLHFHAVASHEASPVSPGLLLLCRAECPFHAGATGKPGRPGCLPTAPRAFSDQSRRRSCAIQR